MVPMMESIAGELCERVMRVINFRTLFTSHPEDVKRRAVDAKQMMDLWKSTYLEMRARIEAAGCDARWEFDRKKLFENTEFIASVCQDIANVAQVSQTPILLSQSCPSVRLSHRCRRRGRQGHMGHVPPPRPSPLQNGNIFLAIIMQNLGILLLLFGANRKPGILIICRANIV